MLGHIIPKFGQENELDGGVYIGDGIDISIGNKCQINHGCRLGNLSIGNYVIIGPDDTFIYQLHETKSIEIPMIFQGRIKCPPTIIEDDVWIGTKAIIMPGIRICRGAIIGAGAVVTKNIPPYSVAVGVPAVVKKQREQG